MGAKDNTAKRPRHEAEGECPVGQQLTGKGIGVGEEQIRKYQGGGHTVDEAEIVPLDVVVPTDACHHHFDQVSPRQDNQGILFNADWW